MHNIYSTYTPIMYKKFHKYTITYSYKKIFLLMYNIAASSDRNHKLHKLQYTYNYLK